MAAHDGLGTEKDCVVCGRRFGWRKSWASSWSTIQHCSVACQRRRLGTVDEALEGAILKLLQTSTAIAVDPLDAAQTLKADAKGLSARARDAARRLAARGQVEFVQSGRLVDPSSAKGPVLVRLRATASAPAVAPESRRANESRQSRGSST